MPLWIFSFLLLFLGLKLALSDFEMGEKIFGNARARKAVKKVGARLQELEEMLSAGVLPQNSKWEDLRSLPDPWGSLAYESIQELRKHGSALIPTLKRLHSLSVEHDTALAEARAKSSQAIAQALACFCIVPLFSCALYFLLPGLDEHLIEWWAGSLIAVFWGGAGAIWTLCMADGARWAGLPLSARGWVLSAQCSIERFLALVRSGSPPDLAWTRSMELLSRDAPGLALAWGNSIWTSGISVRGRNASLNSLIETGNSIRKAIQVCILEGRPCLEGVETALLALKNEMHSRIQTELSLLGTRALKPLFFCVAPSALGLLPFGIWLSWSHLAT